jgi:hypothetical protein
MIGTELGSSRIATLPQTYLNYANMESTSPRRLCPYFAFPFRPHLTFETTSNLPRDKLVTSVDLYVLYSNLVPAVPVIYNMICTVQLAQIMGWNPVLSRVRVNTFRRFFVRIPSGIRCRRLRASVRMSCMVAESGRISRS